MYTSPLYTPVQWNPATGTVTAAITCHIDLPLLTGIRTPNRTLAEAVNAETIPSEAGRQYRATLADSGTLLTEITCKPDGITFRQQVESPAQGIAGCYFTVEIPDEHSVLVPAWNGVRLSKENPLFWDGWTSRVEIGLLDLQLPMLIFEGKEGGFLLYAEDIGNQFKAFDIRHIDNRFRIQIETIPQAPFADIHTFTTVPWHMIPYTGEWCNAAEQYRSILNACYHLDEADARRPAWAKDIALFFLADIRDKGEMDTLATRIDPRKVLLQIPGWRKELYDVNWPDLTPRDGFSDDIAYAHKLGFKVQIHTNMNGFQQELPEFAAYADYQCRDKYTHELIYADFSDAVRHYKFAQMNPASAKWRQCLIRHIVKAVEETGADAVHLDESLFARNDQNGLIDGLTSQQGNILLHRELTEALPGIAIGGEGITECNAQYTAFPQSHVYAVGDPVYIPNQIEQIVPLTCAVMRDYIRPYHWPGYPQAKQEHAFLLWHLTGQATGLTATIMRESAHTIGEVYAPCLRAVIEEANFLSNNEARHRFDGLGNGVLMRWQLKDGTVAASVRTEEGYAFLMDETKPETALYRIVLNADNQLSVK